MKKLSAILIIVMCFISFVPVNAESSEADTANYTETKYEDVYLKDDGKLYMYLPEYNTGQYRTYTQKAEENFLPVGKFEFDISDTHSYNFVMNHPNISKELKDYIIQIKIDSERGVAVDGKVTIFSPELLNTTTRSTQSIYKTYNGKSMRTDRIYVSKSTNMSNVSIPGSSSSGVKTLLFEIAGASSQYLSIAGSGMSILNAFLSDLGGTVRVAV